MKETTVTIERSEHHHPPVPKGVVRLIEYELARRGIHGHFNLQWGPRFKGTPHTPRFNVVKLTERNNVELEIKPGGNDTAHTCWLSAGQATDVKTGEKPPTMEELLVALQMQPQGAEMMGEGFSDDASNVKGVLRVIGAMGGYDVAIESLREQLSEVYPQVTRRGWGLILSTMQRRGLLSLKQLPGGGIYSVSLAPPGAKQLNGSAPPPPIVAEEHTNGAPTADAPADQALLDWLRQLEEQEDRLLAEVLAAEDEEKRAVARAKELRASLAATSKKAAAARVLLGEEK